MELGAVIALAIIVKVIAPTKSSRKRKSSKSQGANQKKGQRNNRSSSAKRLDAEILRSSVSNLSWAEFERLLALYFLDRGYEVKEPGIGGNDGGVDLVITDKRMKKRTAVQAKKHWADRRHVGPNIIRELHSARLNTKPTCLYAMLITSSDVSPQARKEAEDRHIEFWHRATLERRLEKWAKWARKAVTQTSLMIVNIGIESGGQTSEKCGFIGESQ